MTKTIDQLNSFLRGEISAVETYKIAIPTLTKSTFVAALRDNLASHEDRVRLLRAEIMRYGGTPAEGSGAWGAFAKFIEGGAAALGESAAVVVLEEGEDHGRNDYQRALDDIDPTKREFVQGLLSEQLKTHAVLSKLKRKMSEEAPQYSSHR